MGAKSVLLQLTIAGLLTVIASCASSANNDHEPRQAATSVNSVTPSKFPFVTTTVPPSSNESGLSMLPSGDKTLRELLEQYRIAIIARPISIPGEFEPVGSVPHTVFQLDIERVIAGSDIVDGDAAFLMVEGGTMDSGEAPKTIPLRDPPEIGKLYLFLLADARGAGYPGLAAPGYMRFEIDEQGRVIPNGAEGTTGIRAISGISEEQYAAAVASGSPKDELHKLQGQSVDDAVVAIEKAMAEGPVPPYPDWWGLTPTPAGQTPMPFFGQEPVKDPVTPTTPESLAPTPTETPTPAAAPVEALETLAN